MKKIAFFVEGQTEQIFLESLIDFVASDNRVKIESKRANGGRRYPRCLIEIHVKGAGEDFFVLIVDCGTDGRVVSDIKENARGLREKGFEQVIGLRDVRPQVCRRDAEKLRRGLTAAVAGCGLDVKIALAIMEIESWFLAEDTHFVRIDPELTRERIVDEMGFFPGDIDVTEREFPSNDLSRIYGIAGKVYSKERIVVEDVVGKMDFDYIKDKVCSKIDDLGCVFERMDMFFRG